jgi:hypothetical protein
MNILLKFKETLSSVLPIMIIVFVLGVTVAPLGSELLIRFLVGGAFVIIGLAVFLFGVDIGILPVGERCGAVLTGKRNLSMLLIVSFIIGFMITVAEPDVQVLADQVRSIDPGVNKWGLIFMIAAGIGLFVSLGIFRTVISIPLNYLLIALYLFVFFLAFATPSQFQGVAFDSGGATTGPMTVPFIMALGVGVASVRSGKGKKSGNSSDDSFGLTGIASIGPIAAVCLYGIILLRSTDPAGETLKTAGSIKPVVVGLEVFTQALPGIVHEVAGALAPLALLFIFLQQFLLKMPPFQVVRVIRGLFFSFIGLVLFLLGAQGGFMPAGNRLGEILGLLAVQSDWGSALLIGIGFIFGAVVVCAEPAVWVLTEQVEDVSGGTIKRKVMLVALSIGVAVSIALAMWRVLDRFSLWYILVPGYAVSLILSLFCPRLFTGIAFDSGGVASGPMTSTFILSFTLGASFSSGGNPAVDAFGVISLVAMTPLIAIQVLGIIFKIKGGTAQ